jgi:hypothetical protein
VEEAGLLHRGRGKGTILPRSSFDGEGNYGGRGCVLCWKHVGEAVCCVLDGASPFPGGCLSVMRQLWTLEER